MEEVEFFYNKPKINQARMMVSKATDFIGLEDVMMQDTKRFAKAICSSKHAKVVKINANKLFKKLNDQDTIREMRELSAKKLKLF